MLALVVLLAVPLGAVELQDAVRALLDDSPLFAPTVLGVDMIGFWNIHVSNIIWADNLPQCETIETWSKPSFVACGFHCSPLLFNFFWKINKTWKNSALTVCGSHRYFAFHPSQRSLTRALAERREFACASRLVTSPSATSSSARATTKGFRNESRKSWSVEKILHGDHTVPSWVGSEGF